MRVLSTAAPGSGLFLSTIPLAWALRAAGHDVLVANTGAASRSIAASGFSTVDVCPEQDVFAEFMARGGLGTFGVLMADGLLRVARDFRPDVVLSTLEQSAGALVAAELGVPLIEPSVRLAWAGQDEPAARFRTAGRDQLVAARGEGTVLREADAVLDLRPPSMGGHADERQWSMRYVPYNEGRVLPDWVLGAPERPRVCVTMGTVAGVGGDDTIRRLFAAALHAVVTELAGLDIEIVLAMADNAIDEVGPLPGNVRSVGWLPLDTLLPGCAAIVHHGGAGTAFTALAHGVPQLVLPRGADRPANAAVVAERGVGLVCPPAEITPDAVRDRLVRLLDEPGFAKSAADVRDEIAAMPSPAAVAARVADLVSAFADQPSS